MSNTSGYGAWRAALICYFTPSRSTNRWPWLGHRSTVTPYRLTRTHTLCTYIVEVSKAFFIDINCLN